MEAQAMTGHRTEPPVQFMVTMASCSSFLWNSKVMEILSASKMKVGVVVTEEGSGSEEMENAQTEELGSALLRVGNA
jgi:hypothetical protein